MRVLHIMRDIVNIKLCRPVKVVMSDKFNIYKSAVLILYYTRVY